MRNGGMMNQGYTAEQWEQYEVRRKAWTTYGATDPYQYAAVLASMFGNPNPRQILDIGCGDATLLNGFREVYPDASLFGIDASQAAINHAIGSNAPNAGRLNLSVADMDTWESPRAFDIITALFCLYHSANPLKAVRRYAEMLSDDGVIIMSTIDPSSMRDVWNTIGWSDRSPLENFTAADAVNALVEADLIPIFISKYHTPVVFPNHDELHNFVASTLSSGHLADRVDESTPLISTISVDFAVGVVL